MSSAAIALAENFIASANALAPADTRRIMRAVDRLRKDPGHPSLNLHPVRTDPTGRLHTIRASDEIRVLLSKTDNTYVLIEAGHHDDLYLRAGRGRFLAASEHRFIGFVSPSDDETPAVPDSRGAQAAGATDTRQSVLSHWTRAELLAAGFSEADVDTLHGCCSYSELLDLDLPDDVLMAAIDLVETTPEAHAKGEPPLADNAEIREAVEAIGHEWGLSRFYSEEELDNLLAAPIERWMVFLHPNQRKVVDARYDGPARIAGPAGTGKTAVALHRAAALARRFAEEDADSLILFTTYISSLPPLFEQLYLGLPDAVEGGVEFINVDRLARWVCRQVGPSPRVSRDAVSQAFRDTWKDLVGTDTPLGRAGVTKDYLKEEISWVIKGRGLETVDDYLALDRTGRRTRFAEGQRRQAWRVMEQWNERMDAAGTVDFIDVIKLALDAALTFEGPVYRAAIIDEAQDLSLIALQMVRTLVNGGARERPDSLLLVGDGGQRIYTSCFTMRQAGVEIRGRSTRLTENYRNSLEILDCALAVAGDRSVEDLGEEFRRRDAIARCGRHGKRPTLFVAEDDDAQYAYIVEQLAVAEEAGVELGDVAVLLPTNRQVWRAVKTLEAGGIPCKQLKDYEASITRQVKVGTYHRSKGLEFKLVFLPELTDGVFPRPQGKNEPDAAYEERLDLDMSTLYVAMTRARDELHLLCTSEPSEVLSDALSVVDQMVPSASS